MTTESSSAAKDKKFDSSFSLTDNEGNSYLFVRSGKGFFNIARCEIFSDGLIPDAVHFTDEKVAELVGQQEERVERLARVEAALREWIDVRRAWSRRAKQGSKLPLQKKEAVD